jgi:hypothetical protein
MTICTGTNLQFANTLVCLDACARFFPAIKSPPYSTADTVNDDFGCRMYHLTLAAQSPAIAQTECQHIVPSSSTCRQ